MAAEKIDDDNQLNMTTPEPSQQIKKGHDCTKGKLTRDDVQMYTKCRKKRNGM